MKFATDTRTDSLRRPSNVDRLSTMCTRAQKFENVMSTMRPRLIQTTNDVLVKHCVSHHEELLDQPDIKVVSEYQTRIMDYRLKLDQKFKLVDEEFADYIDLKVPFVASYGISCVSEGQRVNAIIEQTTSLMLDICDIMKKWANDDKSYSSRLWDEVISTNGQHGKILQEIKKHVRRKDALTHTLKVNRCRMNEIFNPYNYNWYIIILSTQAHFYICIGEADFEKKTEDQILKYGQEYATATDEHLSAVQFLQETTDNIEKRRNDLRCNEDNIKNR